jgi:hypothetical protein
MKLAVYVPYAQEESRMHKTIKEFVYCFISTCHIVNDILMQCLNPVRISTYVYDKQ